MGPFGGDESAGPSNRLSARSIRTGKLKWELGGPSGTRPLRQPDTFFLGPPLPLMGSLYVLAEQKEEVRLLALDPATGDLLWSQQLSAVEQEPGLVQDAAAPPHGRLAILRRRNPRLPHHHRRAGGR